ncbi:hypothetical protein ACFQU1_22095 [Chelatococcus sp. GCM10030263]|uniref:hypothetical protein n=1 Tax=Chelatococcus sp. GCM10030263 TaxID=3273387 RepID=UPI00361D27A2
MKALLITGIALAGLTAGISGAGAQTFIVTPTPLTKAVKLVPTIPNTMVEHVLPIASGLKVVPGSIVPRYVPLTYVTGIIASSGGRVTFTPDNKKRSLILSGIESPGVVIPHYGAFAYFVSPDKKMVFVNPVSREVTRIASF